MKLWLISQVKNQGYDTFDSAVVAAKDALTAARTNPRESNIWPWNKEAARDTWVETPEEVTVEYLGEAALGTKTGVICASFNAG